MEVRRRKVVVHSTFAVSQLPAAAIAKGSLRVGFRKLAFPISSADRIGFKNLPRQIISVCVKFGGNLCRDVETLGFYTDRHRQTHTDTQMKYQPVKAGPPEN